MRSPCTWKANVSVSRWGQSGLPPPRGALKRPADTQNLLETGSASAFSTHFVVPAGDFNHRRAVRDHLSQMRYAHSELEMNLAWLEYFKPEVAKLTQRLG